MQKLLSTLTIINNKIHFPIVMYMYKNFKTDYLYIKKETNFSSRSNTTT